MAVNSDQMLGDEQSIDGGKGPRTPSSTTGVFAVVVGLLSVATVLLLAVTGSYLTWFYTPSGANAWDDIDGLQREIAWGLRVRNGHSFLAMILPWLLGLWLGLVAAARWRWPGPAAALGLSLIAIFTGPRIAWDQLALYDVTIGQNISGLLPFFQAENGIKFALVDGAVVDPSSIRAWSVAHVCAGLAVAVAACVGVVRSRRRAPSH